MAVVKDLSGRPDPGPREWGVGRGDPEPPSYALLGALLGFG